MSSVRFKVQNRHGVIHFDLTASEKARVIKVLES